MKRLLLRSSLLVVVLSFTLTFVEASTIRVPQDALTIQGAVNVATETEGET